MHHTQKPSAFWTIAAGTLFLATLGCFSSSTDDNNEPDPTTPKVCPFTFPEATEMFPQGASVSLLNFPVFPGITVREEGEDGKGTLYIANSEITYTRSDGVPTGGPLIGYNQAFQGLAVMFTPEEVPAEIERIDTNAKSLFFGATTSMEKLTLGGQEVDVHISDADASKIMTIFIPIEEGKLIAPVSLGVYASVVGCEETMAQVFTTLKAEVKLNTETTYHDLEGIQQLKADKLGTE